MHKMLTTQLISLLFCTEGFIYINFQEFLADLKDSKARGELELTGSKHRATSSIGSDGSDSEIRRMMMRAGIQ